MKGEISADRKMSRKDGFGLRAEGWGKKESSGLWCTEVENRETKKGFGKMCGLEIGHNSFKLFWGKCR